MNIKFHSFSKSSQFFTNHLNYSLTNEDNRIESSLISDPDKRIFSIAMSGSQIVDYLLCNPRELVLLDISWPQLALCHLRICALRQLNYQEFIHFLGYHEPAPSQERKEIFDKLRLPDNLKAFWKNLFDNHKWSAPLYFGTFERQTIKLHKLAKYLVGSELKQLSQPSQSFHHLPWRFKAVIRIIACFPHLSAYLGRQMPFMNAEESFYQTYLNIFSKIVKICESHKSPFLSLICTGRLQGFDTWLQEANEACFYTAKRNLESCQITLIHADLETFFKTSRNNLYDYIFTSNVLGYLPQNQRIACNKNLSRALNKDGIVVHRFFRFNPDPSEFAGLSENTLCYKNQKVSECLKKDNMPFYSVKFLSISS